MAKGKKRLVKEKAPTYEDYKRKYYTEREKIKRSGHQIYDDRIYSREEWEAVYRAEFNSQNREIAKGEREKLGDINDILVQRQSYKYSRKQAKHIREEYYKETGIYKSEKEIMMEDVERNDFGGFFDMLQKEYNQRFAEATVGMTKEEIRKKKVASNIKLAISQQYFGSN